MTARAKQICKEMPLVKALPGLDGRFGGTTGRKVVMSSLQPQGKVKADRDRGILYGDTEIDLSFVEQLVDTSQTRFIMDCLVYLGNKIQSNLSIQEIIQHLDEALTSGPWKDCPLDLVSPWQTPNGSYSRPRMFEIVAAINRMRSLRVKYSQI